MAGLFIHYLSLSSGIFLAPLVVTMELLLVEKPDFRKHLITLLVPYVLCLKKKKCSSLQQYENRWTTVFPGNESTSQEDRHSLEPRKHGEPTHLTGTLPFQGSSRRIPVTWLSFRGLCSETFVKPPKQGRLLLEHNLSSVYTYFTCTNSILQYYHGD